MSEASGSPDNESSGVDMTPSSPSSPMRGSSSPGSSSWLPPCSLVSAAVVPFLILPMLWGMEIEERLIGWKGETHSIQGKGPNDDETQGCTGVDIGQQIQHPPKQWLYRYPRSLEDGPQYTHMAMLTRLPNGTLLAAWQAGADSEGTRQQHFVTCLSLDGDVGEKWAAPQTLEAVGDGLHPVWGPAFLVDERLGRLWLFYSQSTSDCHGRVRVSPGGDIKAISYDLEAQLWGPPQLLLSIDSGGGIPKVTANKAIELSSGEFVLPFWGEKAAFKRSPGCGALAGDHSAGVLVSKDRGATWAPSAPVAKKGVWLIENAVAELRTGALLMVFRTNAQRVYASRSEDKGESWTAPRHLVDFKNPNSKVDLLRIQPGGELALAFNDHVEAKQDKSLQKRGCTRCRTNLKVAVSPDGGETWRVAAELEDAVAPTLRFHYPALQQSGCAIFVAYSEFHRVNISPDDPDFTNQGIKVARIDLRPR